MSTTKQDSRIVPREERRARLYAYVSARLEEIERQDREEDIKRLQARAEKRLQRENRKPK